ncbi:MoxR family ATPase [Actinomycetes bacterium KLBMP 9797]
MADWHLFTGRGEQHDWTEPPTPPWRQFGELVTDLVPNPEADSPRPVDLERARAYRPGPNDVNLVNVALYLRRPLLITGKPGTGKSTLAYAIAHELKLGQVLRWPISSRSTLQDGLYRYDAVARLQDANLGQATGIGRYIQLGPLGTALLPYERPRVLLIDEIDKSDIDLPNDLLNVFEEGEFRIPELTRITDSEAAVRVNADGVGVDAPVTVRDGVVRCRAFPIVVLTSNGERDFPPAFLRRCVQLDLVEPDRERLTSIVTAHLGEEVTEHAAALIDQFLDRRSAGELATDQLLNAVFLTSHVAREQGTRDELAALILRQLTARR